jgi:superfamily I DNA/RNA helicase
VLSAALGILTNFSPPIRIPKHLTSLYATAQPPVNGHAHWWKLSSPQAEATAIANSCLDLHAAGLDYGDIMILLGNRRVMATSIQGALENQGVPFSPVQVEAFRDTPAGRAGFSMLRILSDPNDLVAYRNLLSLLPQMGATRCLDLTLRCHTANMNGLDLYTGHIPNGVLTNMQLDKVQQIRTIATTLQGFDLADTLAQRGAALAQLVEDLRGQPDRHEWDAFVQTLPQDAALSELSDMLYADNLEENAAVVSAVHTRLDLPIPQAINPDCVQVMTMHGAKGLSAKVVFIPSLEETIFPNQRRAAKPGLVDEGARLLYVSVTRARAAAILTCSHGRNQNGVFVHNLVSRYLPYSGLHMQYQQQPTGLGPQLAQAIAATCASL